MTITNPPAWETFRDGLGQEFYVDFSPVPAEALDPTLHAFVESDVPEGNYGHACCVECGQPEEAHA